MIDNATAFDPVAQAMAGSMHTFPKAMRDALSETCATAMRPCAILARSDGQGSILIANGRSRNEEDWKQFIPCNGDWHTTGHFLFCGHKGYYDSKYGLTMSLLQKEKVAKHIKDFTNDSYRQASQHILADQVGTLHYLCGEAAAYTGTSPAALAMAELQRQMSGRYDSDSDSDAAANNVAPANNVVNSQRGEQDFSCWSARGNWTLNGYTWHEAHRLHGRAG